MDRDGVLEAVRAAVDQRIRSHEEHSEKLAEQINEQSLSRDRKLLRSQRRLVATMDRLCKAIETAQEGLDTRRLVLWLVGAIILSNVGSRGLEIIAKAMGLP